MQGIGRRGSSVYEEPLRHNHRSESFHRYLHGDLEVKDAPMYL